MTDANGAEGKVNAEPEGSDEFGAAWDQFRDDDLKEAGQLPEGAESPEPAAGTTGAGQGDKPPLQDEAASKAPAPAEIPNDVWANAPPELREAHLREVEKRDALIRSHSGRLSRADHELQALRQRIESGSTGPKPVAGSEAGNESDRLKQLREQYPEIAEPLLEHMATLESEVRDLKGARVSQDHERSEALLLQQEQILTEKHPGWQAKASSDEFRRWAMAQPRYVQEAIERNGVQIVDGAETADVIDRFIADTRPADSSPAQERHQSRRAEQLEGSRSTPAKTPSVSSGGGASDFDGAWNEFAEKDRRRSAGRRS